MIMLKTETSDYLYDAALLRPFAIVLMVLYHSMIIFTGGWDIPEGLHSVGLYKWIGKLSYSFMLELFVFVSGYVFALSLEKKRPTFTQVVVSKLNRLILPSVLFSVAYCLMFYDLTDWNAVTFARTIISGCGHLWFLPMLFWVSILAYVLDRLRMPWWLKLTGILLLPLLSGFRMPFRIDNSMYYLPFFCVGMAFYRNRDAWRDNLCDARWLSVTLIMFCVLFLAGNTQFVPKDLFCVSLYIKLGYSFFGVMFSYILANMIVSRSDAQSAGCVVRLNKVCFGVYLFQQFILMFLYYHTNLPSAVGSYWLPWIGFSVALVTSFLLTELFRMSKIGRSIL